MFCFFIYSCSMDSFGFSVLFCCFCFNEEMCSACRDNIAEPVCISCLSIFFFIFTVIHFTFVCFLELFYLPLQNLLCIAKGGGEKFAPAGTCSGSEHSEMSHQCFVGQGMPWSGNQNLFWSFASNIKK